MKRIGMTGIFLALLLLPVLGCTTIEIVEDERTRIFTRGTTITIINTTTEFLDIVGKEIDQRIGPGEEIVILLRPCLFAEDDRCQRIELGVRIWDAPQNGKLLDVQIERFWVGERRRTHIWVIRDRRRRW